MEDLKIADPLKKKIAIPISDGELDTHFGHCKQFAVIDTEGENIVETNYLEAPPHQPGLLPRWLPERGVTDVIAGGMGQRAIELFNARGVNVFVGAPKLSPEKLVKGYLEKSILFSSNLCDH